MREVGGWRVRLSGVRPVLHMLILGHLGNPGSHEQKASHSYHLPYKGAQEGRCPWSGEEAPDADPLPREQAWGLGDWMHTHIHPLSAVSLRVVVWLL